MTSRDWIRTARTLAMLGALGPLGGCKSDGFRPPGHPHSSLLDSGPTPKVTSLQAADVQVAMGRALEQEGKFEEARPAYLSALKKDPRRADAELRLAILDDRKGDAAGADRHFARALALEPRSPEILCDQGYSFYLRRRWADAEGSLRRALSVDPGHPRSHNNLGLVLARQGDYKGALHEFGRAGCDPSDARSNLALMFAMDGQFDEARRQYALALKAKPGSPLATEGLKAATVAMTGKPSPRAIASTDRPSPDPAIQRTSSTPAR